MNTLSKTLLIAALAAAPFAGAQARDQSAHEAWIKAQKIDIKPTLKVTETEIPADSAAGAANSTTAPGGTGSQGSTYSPSSPSSNMPSSPGGYTPAAPSAPAPQGGAPIYTQPGMGSGGSGTGIQPRQ